MELYDPAPDQGCSLLKAGSYKFTDPKEHLAPPFREGAPSGYPSLDFRLFAFLPALLRQL